MRLLVFGGIVIDYTCSVKDIGRKCTRVLEFEQSIGGMGYNTAVAAAELGIETELVAAVGGDFPGVEKGRVSLNLHKNREKSTRCFLFHDDRDERIFFYRGAYHGLDVAKAEGRLKTTDWVHFAGVIPAFAKLIQTAKKSGKRVSANPGYDLLHYEKNDPVVKKLVEDSDLLILNEEEFNHLDTARREGLIITRGKKGSTVFEKNKKTEIPAYNVKAESPFGAGDAYTGALIAAMMKGYTTVDAAKIASAAASFAVEEKTTTPKLDWDEVLGRSKRL
jgi:sugar/nucleoside kinase (ribokinase family)